MRNIEPFEETGSVETLIRLKMVEICGYLHQRNMLAAGDGNVSYRLSEEVVLITPSGKPKALIDPSDISMITLNNDVISGEPSSERLMHLAIYKECPLAHSVIHAHPPHCIAWSIARPEWTEFPCEALPEVILATGGIPIVPYARPATQDMGKALRPYLPQSRVMILAHHGGLCWGESLEEAHMGMERMEHAAHILHLAQTLGGLTHLPDEELQDLKRMRQQMGNRTL